MEEKIKAVVIEDAKQYLVKLGYGKFLVDGVEMNGGGSVSVNDIDGIKRYSSSSEIVEYKNKDGEVLSEADYWEKHNKLLEKSIEDDDYDGDIYWPDGTEEEQVTWLKFAKQCWNPVRKDTGKWVDVEIDKTIIKKHSGNKFIEAMFFTSQGDFDGLYYYDRPAALKAIVINKFTSLGMVFNGDCSHGKTDGKKIWGNSSHSGIRYVVAFGTYIMNDKWKVGAGARGSLEDLKVKYEKDKEELESLIQEGYSKHFLRASIEGLDVPNVIAKLERSVRGIEDLTTKVKSSPKSGPIRIINGVIQELYKTFKEEN